MPISPEILSLDPVKVNAAILEIYDQNKKSKNLVARALMHRMVNYVVTANENKEAKKAPALFVELEDGIAITEESSSDHIAAAEAGIDAIGRAKLLAKKLEENVFTPALTAHPTNPKSLEADELLVDIYDLIMLLRNEMAAGDRGAEVQEEKNKTIAEKLKKLSEKGLAAPAQKEGQSQKDHLLEVAESYLTQCCGELSQMSLVPESKLTVEQEVDRNLQIFGKFFGEFNKFKHRIIDQFCERYAVEDPARMAETTKILTPAIAAQFQQIHFWSASDADGNAKITHQTMLEAVKKHQKFLDNLYLAEIARLKIQFAENEVVMAELAIIEKIVKGEQELEAAGAIADAKDSAAIVERIDKIIAGAAPGQFKELIDLRDSFDCFGFVGPKMDVRQSSVRNVIAMQQILDFLREQKVEGIEVFAGNYDSKEFDKKAFTQFLQTPAALDLLATEGSLEKITALAKTKSSDEATAKIAEEELRRMMVAKLYPDIFHRYIISDNKGINSWNEVRALEAIAHRAVRRAEVQDERPLQVYPLCETSEDIQNLPQMIDDLLKNPESVAQLKGRLDLFIGYSDAEKRSGTFALLLLQQKIFESLEIVNAYNKTVPEDQKLKVEIFQGRGNDLIRGGGKKYHSATDQGQAAVDFGFKQEAKAALLAAAGRVDDFDLQMEQWQKLRPEKRQTIAKIIAGAVAKFEDSVSHGKDGEIKHGDELAKFLEAVSMNAALKETNQSSRAPSKGAPSKKLNLDTERAIGLATRFSACGLPFNLLGIGEISPGDAQELSTVCSNLTVIQDIILKTTYALAISDESRARKIAEINGVESAQTEKMFAKFRDSSFEALTNVVKSLPVSRETQHAALMQIANDFSGSKQINETTKAVMTQLSHEIPLIKELLDSVTAYEKNYKPLVHELLGQYKDLNIDPNKDEESKAEGRARLDKDLAVVFREEMQIPRNINNLTTKTPFLSQGGAAIQPTNGEAVAAAVAVAPFQTF